MNRYQFEQKYQASLPTSQAAHTQQQIALPLDTTHVRKLPALKPGQPSRSQKLN